MRAVKIIIRFTDGTEAYFVGPYLSSMSEEKEIAEVEFYNSPDFPDCKVSEIAEVGAEMATKH